MSGSNKHPNADCIDSKAVYDFWEARAQSYLDQEKTGLSNLEPDADLSKEKRRLERQVMDEYVAPQPADIVLDLGAGHGAWEAYFCGKVSHIDCVEYSDTMIRIARQLLTEANITNVAFFHSKAQEFNSDRRYDIILISGLLIYLNKQELNTLLRNLEMMLADGGRIILRDGTAREETYLITDRFSEALKANYSAYYRTAAEYVAVFAEHGFEVTRHQNMFPDGSALNKWAETVLRIYEFGRAEKKR